MDCEPTKTNIKGKKIQDVQTIKKPKMWTVSRK